MRLSDRERGFLFYPPVGLSAVTHFRFYLSFINLISLLVPFLLINGDVLCPSSFTLLSTLLHQVLKYVQMKRECPELFRVSPIDELQFLLDMQMQWMTPERDVGGRQVYIFRVGEWAS